MTSLPDSARVALSMETSTRNAMDSPPPGYITHITVDRISGVGPWVAGV